MSSSNYTILQRNLLASFENEEVKSAFLKAQDQPTDDRYSYKAEAFAREVDRLCSVLKPHIDKAASAYPFEVNNEVKSDLLDFVLTRHWNLNFRKAING